MASSEILRLAREGNPTVIASLLNHVLKPYGVTATVVRHEIRLEIKLVAVEPVDEAAIATLVRQVIHQLNINYIPTVAIAIEAPNSPAAQHSAHPDAHLPEAQEDWTQSATHNSVAWRQAPASPPAAGLPAQPPTAHPSELSPMSATQTPEPQGYSSPTTDAAMSDPANPLTAADPPFETGHSSPSTPSESAAIAPDEALEVFPPPGEPLFENAPAASDGSLAATQPIDLWQRPEAVIFVAYLIAVIVWQLYVDLTAASPNQQSGWTATALAKRLGTSRSTLSRRRYQEDFSAWTQSLDPDGIAWMYVGPRFTPALGADVLPVAPR
ncbi:MAG: hypothetical protein Fur0046_26240 [Cyanobacteria bacterium J069]|nr:MAG: hypothetical protein D6742_02205 [Cyanobacteria bacterium J069]